MAVVCKVLFDPEETEVLSIGVLRIGEDSCLGMDPGSSKADEDWEDPKTCESTGTVKYHLQALDTINLKYVVNKYGEDCNRFWKLSEDMDEPLFVLVWVEEDVHFSHSSEL